MYRKFYVNQLATLSLRSAIIAEAMREGGSITYVDLRFMVACSKRTVVKHLPYEYFHIESTQRTATFIPTAPLIDSGPIGAYMEEDAAELGLTQAIALHHIGYKVDKGRGRTIRRVIRGAEFVAFERSEFMDRCQVGGKRSGLILDELEAKGFIETVKIGGMIFIRKITDQKENSVKPSNHRNFEAFFGLESDKSRGAFRERIARYCKRSGINSVEDAIDQLVDGGYTVEQIDRAMDRTSGYWWVKGFGKSDPLKKPYPRQLVQAINDNEEMGRVDDLTAKIKLFYAGDITAVDLPDGVFDVIKPDPYLHPGSVRDEYQVNRAINLIVGQLADKGAF